MGSSVLSEEECIGDERMSESSDEGAVLGAGDGVEVAVCQCSLSNQGLV